MTSMSNDDLDHLSRDKKNAKIIMLIGLVFFLAGVWILGSFAFNLYSSLTAKSWPRTEGTVLSRGVRKIDKKGSASDRYAPVIRYEYEVEGRRYTNDRYQFGKEERLSESTAGKIVSNYNKGETVEVFYHPEDPQKSTLLTSTSFNPFGVLFGPVVVLAGFFTARYGFRSLRSKATEG